MKRFAKLLLVLLLALGIAVLLFHTPDTDPAEMRAKYGGPPSQFVILDNGQKVHLRDEGPKDAPAIILLHGSNSSLLTWDDWARSLKGTYRVIRYDQVGHGLTGPAQNGDYSKARYVADLDHVADHFALDKFVVVGNSMGGWVATSYAIAHPDRVAGLALLDASGAPRNKEEGRLYLGAEIASIPVLNNIMTVITPRSLVRTSYEDAVADPAMITEAKVDQYWELLRYPGNRQAVIDRAITDRGGPFKPDALAALTMPSLIMWGEEDQVTPISGAKWFEQYLPNARLITYPGVGHVPMEEAPKKSVQDLREWLETLNPRAQ